jgi:hypothetical protein
MPFYCYFLLTLLLELPIVLLLFKPQWKQVLLVGFLLNLFTWPLLHVLLAETRLDINLLETGVALTEGLGYMMLLRCSWKKAFLTSLLVNGISYGFGVVLNNYFL